MRVLVYSTDIVRNELISGYATHTCMRAHTYMHTQTHTHILVPSEDREPTGLKMDIGVSLVIVHRTECCHITPRTVQPDEALASAALMLYCLQDLT